MKRAIFLASLGKGRTSPNPMVGAVILDENKKGKTIILTTHDMGQAKRLAKEILFFDKGKLLEQTKAIKFFTKPKTKEAQNYINGKILL